MSKLHALQKDALPEAPASPGVTRHLAFQGEGCLVVRARGAPGTVSSWHHHGDHDVYGYVVSGHIRLEGGPGGKDVISVGPGDFFHVPPHAIHRDVNPSPDEEAEVISFFRGAGPPAVDVEGPEQPAP